MKTMHHIEEGNTYWLYDHTENKWVGWFANKKALYRYRDQIQLNQNLTGYEKELKKPKWWEADFVTQRGKNKRYQLWLGNRPVDINTIDFSDYEKPYRLRHYSRRYSKSPHGYSGMGPYLKEMARLQEDREWLPNLSKEKLLRHPGFDWYDASRGPHIRSWKHQSKRKHQWKEKASFSGRVLSEEGDSQ